MDDKITFDTITEKISQKIDFPVNEVRFFLEKLVEEMKLYLKKGEIIEIRGFGTFSVKFRKERWGRNIKANKKIFIPAHYSPVFKPGTLLKKKINSKK